jgi:leucyl aminopeptidase
MKCQTFLVLAASIAAVSALSVDTSHQKAVIEDEQPIAPQGQYLIELSPGETRWVTEDDKWELKRVRYQQALECIQ